MKIALLTYWRGRNYGAIIQGWALYNFLMSIGHQVEMIQYSHPGSGAPKWWSWRSYASRHPIKILRHVKNMWHTILLQRSFARDQPTYNIAQPEYGLNIELMEKHPPLADAYVVGSDQMWFVPDEYYYKIFRPHFLPFGNDTIRRIAYSVSTGGGIRYWKAREEFPNLIKRFHAVSVREKTGIEELKGLGIDGVVAVPDPTLLLDPSKYEGYRKMSSPAPESRDVFYILGDVGQSTVRILRSLRSSNSYNIWLQSFKFGRGCDYIPTSAQFLDVIARSKTVITNSFHGSVFSVLFHRQFVVIAFKDDYKNDRVKELLSWVGLENRLVYDISAERITNLLADPINWEMVDGKLSVAREFGRDWLKKVLM